MVLEAETQRATPPIKCLAMSTEFEDPKRGHVQEQYGTKVKEMTGDEIKMVFFLILLSFSAFIVMVVVHRSVVTLLRAIKIFDSAGISSVILLGLIIVIAISMWKVLGNISFPVGSGIPVPSFVAAGVVFLYLTGCLIYLESCSLFSRGISLRILVDLHERGGSSEAENLKAAYGAGLGVEGMLAKRLDTMKKFGLLYIRDDRVGPLTLLGAIFARVAVNFRRLLRMKMVG